jgi:hypothetical protein
MPFDYKHNWHGVMSNRLLDIYANSIFDKDYGSCRFLFVWKNLFFNTKSIRTIYTEQRSDILLVNLKKYTKIRPKYTWIENANNGTNETSCVKTYLVKQNDQTTILNFFFRENFNLIKLQQTSNKFFNKRADFTGINDNLKQQIQQRVKNTYPWLTGRRFRKLIKKNLLLLNKARFNCLSINPTGFSSVKSLIANKELIDLKLLSRGRRLQIMQKNKKIAYTENPKLYIYL